MDAQKEGKIQKQNKNVFKEELKELTATRVKQYANQEKMVDFYIRNNPDMPNQQKGEDSREIANRVAELEKIWQEVVPFIKKIKNYVKKITDQNQTTACYLLFGKIFNSWDAVFLLLKNGFHYESMELIRSIGEANDLVSLFLLEKDDVSLRKWFDGEIVGNAKSREAIQNFMEEEAQVPFQTMKAGVYSALSKYTHISYVAILDSVDVFNKDFDFNKIAGFHYVVNSSSPYARGGILATINSLKHFYGTIKDSKSYEELSAIQKRFYPEMTSEKTRNLITEIINKFKKQNNNSN